MGADAEGPMGTMVTALTWVRHGFAKPTLDTYEPDEALMKKNQKKINKTKASKAGKDLDQVA